MVKGHAQPDMCWTSLAPLHVDMILSLVAAKSIVDAAIIRSARELDIKICVAVCDHQDNLIALNRMDVEDANHWRRAAMTTVEVVERLHEVFGASVQRASYDETKIGKATSARCGEQRTVRRASDGDAGG